MKKTAKKWIAILVIVMLCFSVAACSSSKDVVYPINLDGTEIIVGETTLSALYDAGFTVTALNMSTHVGSSELEASYQLEANSFYTALYAQKGDVEMAALSIVTDSKACPASEAVIGTVKVNSELDQPLDKATFDGISMADLTVKTFQEHVPGCKVREDGSSAYVVGNKYNIRVDYENEAPISVEIKRNYDVDYSS